MTAFEGFEEYTPTHVQANGRTSHELSVYELFVIQALACIQNDIAKIKDELGLTS